MRPGSCDFRLSCCFTLGVLFLFSPGLMYAEINGADSIEWMTVDCEMLVRGQVGKVTTFPGDGDQVYEDTTLSIFEVPKGEYEKKEVTFRWMTYKTEISAAGWMKHKHDMLFFLKKGDAEIEKGKYKGHWTLRTRHAGYIDLDNPERSAISAKMKVLSKSADILNVVRDRVKSIRENPQQIRLLQIGVGADVPGPQQGFIRIDVPWESEAFHVLYRGSSCYLVVPADPEYRELALNLCKSADYNERAKGADMLRNYPDEDVIELLKTLLKDEGAHEWHSSSGEIVNVTYPVRKAAYSSLLSLGIEVGKPILEQKPKGK